MGHLSSPEELECLKRTAECIFGNDCIDKVASQCKDFDTYVDVVHFKSGFSPSLKSLTHFEEALGSEGSILVRIRTVQEPPRILSDTSGLVMSNGNLRSWLELEISEASYD